MRTKLADFLTEEQNQCFRDHGFFNVKGSSGGKYRIFTHTNAGNVEQYVVDIGWISECAHPRYYPHLDGRGIDGGVRMERAREFIELSIITQKLIIEHDEEYWLRVANKAY